MRKLLLILLLFALPARAQLSPASSSTGTITTNGATCAVTNACIVLHMATSNVGYSVTVTGTWTGTLTVEQSGDNQTTWTSATTTTGNTLYTSALLPGITDARVRSSAAMTGTATITITASGPATINNITQTGGTTGISSLTSTNSGLSGAAVIYPNAAPYNITFDGKTCQGTSVTWTNASTTVNCYSSTPTSISSAAVAGNVATITFTTSLPFNPILQGWVSGNTIVVSGYSGADSFYTGTFLITGTTTTTVSYTLVHANAASTSTGVVTNQSIGPFVPGDSTKVGFGTNCSSGVLNCVAASAVRPLGAVTYVSPTAITVAGNSTNLCNTAQCQFYWFTDDRGKWCCGAGTVDGAFQLVRGCASVVAPAGISPIPFGLFNSSGPTCGQSTQAGNLLTNTDIGNSVWGQGMGATIFLLPPDSDFTKCIALGNICMWAGVSGGGNFTIHGGGNGLTGTNNKVLWEPAQNASFFDNISLTEFGSGDLGLLIGAYYLFSNKYEGIYVDQFGSFPCFMSGPNVILSYGSCGDSRQVALSITGAGTTATTNNTYIQATNGTIGVDVGQGGTTVTWNSEQDRSYGAVNGGGTHVYIENGSQAHVNQWQNTSGSANYGFQLANSGKLYLRDSLVNGTVHCVGTNTVAMTTGSYSDQGGNICSGGAVEATVGPNTCTQSAGNGTCALLAGSTNDKGTVRITAGTTTLLNPSFSMNWGGTFTGASATTPECEFTIKNTGTGSWITAAPAGIGLPFVTAISTTAVTVNILTTVNTVATSTYDVGYSGCTAK